MGSRSENILATVPGEAGSVEVISGPALAGPPGEGRRSHSRAADFETRPRTKALDEVSAPQPRRGGFGRSTARSVAGRRKAGVNTVRLHWSRSWTVKLGTAWEAGSA